MSVVGRQLHTNAAAETYPDQSLYPADSVPKLAQRINNALLRADQIARLNNENQDIYWLAPNLDDQTIAKFQKELGRMGYRYQFVTLAGFHSLNTGMFELAHRFSDNGMTAYCELQEKEFALQDQLGFGAVKHQRFVGAGYFDEMQSIISGGRSSTATLAGSTEEGQFEEGAEVQSAAMGTG